ncbi:MAG: hypothetical protein WCO68_11030 [Verrucomicrobiota bacterium]
MKRELLIRIAVILLALLALPLVLVSGVKLLNRGGPDAAQSLKLLKENPEQMQAQPLSDVISQIGGLETKDGFSAQFWMTTDEQVFYTWAKGSSIRSLKPTIKVKRNIPVFLALFLANPGVKSVVAPVSGKINTSSDVTCDLYLISPNGTLSLASKQRVAWKGVPPAPGLVCLARDRGALSFEVIDPLGEYTLVLVVRDNVRKLEMKLSRKLELVD